MTLRVATGGPSVGIALALLVGCGGGGGATTTPSPMTPDFTPDVLRVELPNAPEHWQVTKISFK